MKICKQCGEEFEEKKANQVYCSDVCRNKFWGRQQYLKNQEKRKKDARIYYNENKDKISEYQKQDHVKERRNLKLKERRRTDHVWKLKHAITDRIRKDGRFSNVTDIISNIHYYIGYDIEELVSKLFINDEIIKDYLSFNKLHLDHIIPYHWFLSIDIGDGEFKKCWDINNLRLIPVVENLSRECKSFPWELITELNIQHLLPKGADEVFKECK